MDTFRDLSPQEIQYTLLQFMGQNMGDLKDLDSRIHNKNNTLQGLTLDPEGILKSIPATQSRIAQSVPQAPSPVVPAPLPQAVPENYIAIVQPPVQQHQENPNIQTDHPDQLLFDFINDLQKDNTLAQEIIQISKKVNKIENVVTDIVLKLKQLEKQQSDIISLMVNNKKKLKDQA
jgi:hypothetical protein